MEHEILASSFDDAATERRTIIVPFAKNQDEQEFQEALKTKNQQVLRKIHTRIEEEPGRNIHIEPKDLAPSYLIVGRVEEAKKFYTELYPGRGAAEKAMGDYYADSGETLSAYIYWRLAQRKGHATVYKDIVDLLRKGEFLEQALEELEVQPKDVDDFRNLIEICLKLQQPKKALKYVNVMAYRFKSQFSIYHEIVDYYLKLEQKEMVSEYIDTLTEYIPHGEIMALYIDLLKSHPEHKTYWIASALARAHVRK
jgi:tetratricopeptide (TPR) repeat protein